MNNRPVFFNKVLPKVVDIISQQGFPAHIKPLVIRDIHGRIAIAIDENRSKCSALISSLEKAMLGLGEYCNKTTGGVLCRDDFFGADSVFKSTEIVQWRLPDSNTAIRVLDRQVTGQDWLIPQAASDSLPTRLVFFGVKGGVGRSTALAMLARKLANSGKKVLLIDLDLESPGLSGLLLPPERLADFGIVDWLIEDAVGQGDDVLDRMISVSPLSETTPKEIRIAAAMGNSDLYYLDKLSRAYADVAVESAAESFTKRIRRLVEKLEEIEKPDVVLIDSRAGLHDLAAVSIVGLASTAFLFATDTPQSWQGYKLLFSHWQLHPEIAVKVRDRLAIVQALFPEKDQTKRATAFLERSYKLFSETLYEEIPPGANEDVFNFDLDDESAPHYPMRINWNNRFQEFDPLVLDKGLFSDSEIEASFGNFFREHCNVLRKKSNEPIYFSKRRNTPSFERGIA
jgi:MinD-like ATPase involved in chromosome partitioning or flagellar assembly